LISCNNGKQHPTVEISNEVNIVENDLESETNFNEINFEQYYLPLETIEGQNLIAKIDKIDFYKDRILILDRKVTKSLFIFSHKGKYIAKINNIGDGPGEFRDPYDFTINTDLKQIVLYDRYKTKLLFYDLNGKFIEEKSIGLNFRSFNYLNSKYYLFTHSIYNFLDNFGEITDDLIILDKSLNVLKTYFKNNSKQGIGIGIFTFDDYFTVADNKLFLSIPLEDTIYVIGNNDNVLKYCQFNFQNSRTPPPNRKSQNYSNLQTYKDVVIDDLYSCRYGQLKYANGNFLTSIAVKGNKGKEKFYYVLLSEDLSMKSIFNTLTNEDNVDFAFPLASYNEYFVSILYPEEIFSKNTDNDGLTSIKLKGVENKILKYDNPVLLFTKLKFNEKRNYYL
jgi:hypothetical protein